MCEGFEEVGVECVDVGGYCEDGGVKAVGEVGEALGGLLLELLEGFWGLCWLFSGWGGLETREEVVVADSGIIFGCFVY